MNKLPKEKRDRLILVVISTVVALVAIYFGLIRVQHATIDQIKSDTNTAQNKLLSVEDAIKKSEATRTSLYDINDTLSHAEEDMASGDTYAWTVDTIRHFKTSYKVDTAVGDRPTTGDVDILAGFPYKQLKFNISGTAHYHDLGKFICDLENKYPHIRVVNLVIDPVGGTGDDAEKIAFNMNIIALIKPNAASR
jgi:hypothetical protein